MSNGYILLWRKSLDSIVWADAKLWRLWSWCLLRASWKERTVLLGRTPVRLLPGDMALTLAEISAGTGLSQKEVRSCLALGKKAGCMHVRGTAKGTLIRLVNWQEYQRPGAEQDQPQFLSSGKVAGTPKATASAGHRARQTARPAADLGQAPGEPSPKGRKKERRVTTPTTPCVGARGPGSPDVNGRRGADCEEFLARYPKRTAQAAARAAWARLERELPGGLPPLAELLAAVDTQARSAAWTREAGRYIPTPANWLLGLRWQDAQDDEAGQCGPSGIDQWLRTMTASPGPARDEP